ncbi:lysophospholipid acyltransferase family protein [Caldichromatium japonicum]|uniref:Lysophospholipid acyltransferase family protein n=2 Tax=Caldichromatium japonicum TaxID=2699430 RepID=A0A6G7VH22_9GAMM|nr:lysophospholipid acyltransferase family protein [Caldichromatium japonicum]QIK39165.1 lysophospholipid acyltransferase family protein [Caldichromatium japonicum]
MLDSQRLQTLAARTLLDLLARLPLPGVHRLGATLGWLIGRWPNRQRRNALINIALCFPELAPAEQRRLRDASLAEFGKTYLEIAHFWRRPVPEVLGLVREVRGAEHLARPAGRGLIVLSPHHGAWELAGLHLASLGPTTIFYRSQGPFDALIQGGRVRTGARLAPINAAGIRLLLETLQRGDQVGVLPDQEPKADKGAVFAPFFGIPAFTMLLVNRLARRTGAKVVFMFAERLPCGQGFIIHCLPAPPGIDSADEIKAATALNRGIEHCVRLCPAQYLWSYKRFRKRPHWLPKVYTGPLDDHAALAQVARLCLRLAAGQGSGLE